MIVVLPAYMNERTARRNGRPPLDDTDQSVRISFRVPSRQYDDLCQRAQRERVNISDVIRRHLPEHDDDDD
jgi:hypothetical protein